MLHAAITDLHRLFPKRSQHDDTSGNHSAVDDEGAEVTSGLQCPMSTTVDKESREVTVQECEEEDDIEAELLSEFAAYAAGMALWNVLMSQQRKHVTKLYQQWKVPQANQVSPEAKVRTMQVFVLIGSVADMDWQERRLDLQLTRC